MKYRSLFCLYFLCSMLISPALSMELQKLEVEYHQYPLALDVPSPRFGWQLVSNPHERGIYQTAYQLEVKDEAGKVVWNSGKVLTDVSQHVTYQGKALKPATRYIWKVKIWNNKGEIAEKDAWFETSLMTKKAGTEHVGLEAVTRIWCFIHIICQYSDWIVHFR